MLQAIHPLALVLAPIRIRVHAIALLFVLHVVTLISSPVLPLVNAMSVHDPVLETAFESATIRPCELPFALHFVIDPSAGVARAISPKVNSLPRLNAFLKLSQVVAALRPHFHTGEGSASVVSRCKYLPENL